MAWFVTGTADPKQASGTVTPYIFQAASEAAAEKQIGGPPLAGPFATKAQAQAWVTANPGDFGAGKTGGTPYNDYIGAGTPGPSNPLTGLAAIGDFFSRLTSPAIWLRVAEVLLGAGLIIVALAKLASNTSVGRAAAKAGKAAMIL